MMALDLNNIETECILISIGLFIFLVILSILLIIKYRDLEKEKETNAVLNATIKTLESTLESNTRQEIDVLEHFGVVGEDRSYKDIKNKVIIPINISRNINLTEGSFAYFVDETKKKEFALHGAKREIAKDIVDILLDKGLIVWEDAIDPMEMRYKVTGKIAILTSKTKGREYNGQ